jgi:CRISPR-associated endonuclease Cas1
MTSAKRNPLPRRAAATVASSGRIVAEGPAMSPDDVADRMAAITETYGPDSSSEVATVDGFAARVIVRRGHLELHDGVGEHRRVRRFAKVDAPRRLVVGIGTQGIVSIDALRFCARVGTPVVVLGADGAILAGGPPGRDDARLLRAQALALYGPIGVEITRYLIAEKLRGQARVVGLRLAEDDAASTLLDLATAVETAGSIDEVRQLEAAGANVAFAAWEHCVEVTFVRKDLPRIPEHWRRMNGRRSSVNPGSPRSATDPCGALLNYGYKLAEIEATLAARRLGLSESLGVLHADALGRPSFSCDLQEAIRPLVDAHVLDLCAGPLRKRDFTEDARGVVRCMAPLTHRMAEAMPAYAHALGPVVEHVAGLLAASSPYDVRVPTILSGAKHKAAARRRMEAERAEAASNPTSTRGPGVVGLAPRGRQRPKAVTTPPPSPATCYGCGTELSVETNRTRSRRGWCDECLPERREEAGAEIQGASRAHAVAFAEATGTRPTHTREATAARSAANRQQRADQETWAALKAEKLTYDAELDTGRTWYAEHVAPKLVLITLPAIARATGVSTSAASKWRAGRTTPHPRHWSHLAELVGAEPAKTAAP